MKVPNAYVGRTKPSTQGLGYLEAATNSGGEMVGKAVANFGETLVDYSVLAKTQEIQSQRFDSLQKEAAAKTQWEVKQQEIDKSADPTGAGYYETVKSEAAKFKTEFLKTLPESQQKEFGARISVWEQGLGKDAIAYQYKLGDQNYRTGIDSIYQKALVGIDADVTTATDWRRQLNESLDAAANMNRPEKELLRKQLMTALDGAEFKGEETKKRYGVNIAFQEFQTGISKELDNITRGVPADVPGGVKGGKPQAGEISISGPRGYYAASAKLFDTRAAAFLAKQPADMQDATRAKLAEVKGNVLAQALAYSNKDGDAEDISAVKTQIDASRTILNQRPEELEKEKAKVDSMIDKTGLSLADKKEWKKTEYQLLETVTAGKHVTELGVGGIPKGNKQEYAMNVLQNTDVGGGEKPTKMMAAAILGTYAGESVGLDPNASRPHDGNCSGPESESIGIGQWNCGRHIALKKFAAERGVPWNTLDLQLAFTAHEMKNNYPQAWAALKAAQNIDEATGIVTTQYTMPRGSPNGPAASSGWAARRDAGRNLYGGKYAPGDIGADANPRFSNVPYEQRISLTKDADAAAARAAAESNRMQTELRNQIQNQSMLDIYHNKRGSSDIENDYSAGKLTDSSDYKAQVDAVAARDKEFAGYKRGMEKLDKSDYGWNPLSEEDKKDQNSIMNAGGPTESVNALIRGQDPNAVNNYLLPNVRRTHMIPTDTLGIVMGMSRSRTPAQFKFGMDTLVALQAADPKAFGAQVNGDLAVDVAAYQAGKGFRSTQEQMHLSGVAVDPAMHSAEAVNRKRGQEYLDQNTSPGSKVKNSDQIFNNLVGKYDKSWFGANPTVGKYEPATAAMKLEYDALWLDNFTKYGNPDDATKYTDLRIMGNAEGIGGLWGVDSSGGRPIVMRNPVSTYYHPLNGFDGFGYVKRNVQQALNLPSNHTFELVSDDQTEAEVKAFQSGGPPPSYAIVAFDENGISRLPPSSLRAGSSARVNFAPTEYDLQEDAKGTKALSVTEAYSKYIDEAAAVRTKAESMGQPYPPEYSNDAVFENQRVYEEKMKVLGPANLPRSLQEGKDQAQPGRKGRTPPPYTPMLESTIKPAFESFAGKVKEMLAGPKYAPPPIVPVSPQYQQDSLEPSQRGRRPK